MELNTFTLGGKQYPIKPLTVGQGTRWRAKVVPMLLEITGTMDASLSDPSALKDAILNAPEKLAEVVFSYSPELPREEIMEASTEQEMSEAFNQVMICAFRPLLSMAGMVKSIARLLSNPGEQLINSSPKATTN